MEILELKKRLPRGWVKILMLETGMSFDTVSGTLNGRFDNVKVIDAAIKLAAKKQAEDEARRKRLEKVVQHPHAA